MKEQKVPFKSLEVFFLSFGYSGFFPRAPGTFASFIILPLLYLLGTWKIPVILLFPFTFFLTVGSCFVTQSVQKKYGVHDPSWIVIDEVIGMTITWFFVPTAHPAYLLGQFLLFRFFDIVKVWPASFLDQKVKHGTGTILDDVVSGLYAGFSFLLLKIYLL